VRRNLAAVHETAERFGRVRKSLYALRRSDQGFPRESPGQTVCEAPGDGVLGRTRRGGRPAAERSPRLAGWAEMWEVHVEPAFRHRGVGTWLVRTAVEWLCPGGSTACWPLRHPTCRRRRWSASPPASAGGRSAGAAAGGGAPAPVRAARSRPGPPTRWRRPGGPGVGACAGTPRSPGRARGRRRAGGGRRPPSGA
jgi:GNAT superfamily N-acetyltransferase